jgi:hypothetical protein
MICRTQFPTSAPVRHSRFTLALLSLTSQQVQVGGVGEAVNYQRSERGEERDITESLWNITRKTAPLQKKLFQM